MILLKRFALFFISLAYMAPAMASDISPIHCSNCESWNTPHKPFQLHANAYYVGTDGLSSVLITSPKGHILIDGALPQSAPQIADNIKALGYDIKDVRWILNSHAHYDHAGGIAALQRMSGAKVGASKAGAIDLRKGMVSASDPQYGYGEEMRFPAVQRVHVLKDREFVQFGNIRVKVNYTPGHTEGATSYSWRSCNSVRCYDLVLPTV
jgi:metallo-beta-lactamase class B